MGNEKQYPIKIIPRFYKLAFITKNQLVKEKAKTLSMDEIG